MVETPVGYKCTACGYNREARYTPHAGRLIAGVLVALAAGWVPGVVGSLGFLGLWLGMFYGRFVGTLVLKATGGRSSLLLEVLAVIALIAGGLIPRFPGLRLLLQGNLQTAMRMPDLLVFVMLIIVAAAMLSRLRWSWSYRGM